MQKKAVIFREELLPYSETFIVSQARLLTRYRPEMLGLRLLHELDIPFPALVPGGPSGVSRAGLVRYKLLSSCPEMSARLRSARPDVVHVHFGGDAARFLPTFRAAAMPEVPLVVTFHGQDAAISDWHKLRSLGWGNWNYLLRRPALRRAATTVIAVSGHIRSKLLAKGFPAEKVVVHHIGVDTDRFRADPAVPREDLVLYVGRLVEKKGGPHLIRAMARVQRARPGVRLAIIGDGPLRPELERLAAGTGCRAEFVGKQTAEQVRDWMNRAKVYCVPSVTARNGDSEGLPITVLEAQAMGLPAALFGVPPVREATDNGATALLAPEGNASALADDILRLLSDAALWGDLARKARRLVETRFDLRTQTGALEDIYDAAVERARQRAGVLGRMRSRSPLEGDAGGRP